MGPLHSDLAGFEIAVDDRYPVSDQFKEAVDGYLKEGYKTRTPAQTAAWVAKLEQDNPKAFAHIEAEAKARRAGKIKTPGLISKGAKGLGAVSLAALIHHTASGAASTLDSLMERDWPGAQSDVEKFLWGAADFANPLAVGAIGAKQNVEGFGRGDLSISDDRLWRSDAREAERVDSPNRIQDAQQFERQEHPVDKLYNELEEQHAVRMAIINSLHTGSQTINRPDLGLASGDGGLPPIVDPEAIIRMSEDAKRKRGVWVDLPNEPNILGAYSDIPFGHAQGGYWTYNPQDYDDDQQRRADLGRIYRLKAKGHPNKARHEVGDPYGRPFFDPSPGLKAGGVFDWEIRDFEGGNGR